ncbi:MAG: pantoate--beta-alanine ligase [Nitrospinae bacterium]|nr:pantoate--beta-alanine ligase [Nitrospinota bacterium]
MKVIGSIVEMHKASLDLRNKRKSIGFVPTMGALHKGHTSLIEKAKKDNDVVILSIFVNPTQFTAGEDYHSYPRDIEKDKTTASDSGIDYLFLPSTDEMYPEGYKTFVNVEDITELLCGKFRLGHFKGVATVVLKLFNIIKPHKAYFGEKDYQQLLVIRRMARDLNLDIEIINMPTIREGNGIAMSSRNRYLNQKEIVSAAAIYKALKISQEMVKDSERISKKIITEMERVIKNEEGINIDYISICDPDTLENVKIINDRALIAIAVRIGNARLIDNCIVEVKEI